MYLGFFLLHMSNSDVTQADRTSRFVSSFFVHTPQLQTLTISSSVGGFDDIMEESNVLDSWERECPSLHTVAFCSKHLWTKGDGLWIRQELPEGYVVDGDHTRFAPAVARTGSAVTV